MDWIDVHVAEVVQETPIDRRLVLDVPSPVRAGFAFRPGQHVLVRAEGPTGEPVKSALSLCSNPRDLGTIEVTVRGRGAFGEVVYALEPGGRIRITGPQGRFRMEGVSGGALSCFADGSGAAPYRGLIAELVQTGHADPVTLVVTEETPETLLYADAYRAYADANDWFRYVPTITGDAAGWTGRRGGIDRELVEHALGTSDAPTVYACGSTAFVETATSLAREAGVADERIAREKWG